MQYLEHTLAYNLFFKSESSPCGNQMCLFFFFVFYIDYCGAKRNPHTVSICKYYWHLNCNTKLNRLSHVSSLLLENYSKCCRVHNESWVIERTFIWLTCSITILSVHCISQIQQCDVAGRGGTYKTLKIIIYLTAEAVLKDTDIAFHHHLSKCEMLISVQLGNIFITGNRFYLFLL